MSHANYFEEEIINCLDKIYQGYTWGKLRDKYYLIDDTVVEEGEEYYIIEEFNSLKDLKDYIDMVIS